MLKLQSEGLSHAQHILDHWRGRGRPSLAVFLRTALKRALSYQGTGLLLCRPQRAEGSGGDGTGDIITEAPMK